MSVLRTARQHLWYGAEPEDFWILEPLEKLEAVSAMSAADSWNSAAASVCALCQRLAASYLSASVIISFRQATASSWF